MTTPTNETMTLEQVANRLRNATHEEIFSTLIEMADAIDAHLRAERVPEVTRDMTLKAIHELRERGWPIRDLASVQEVVNDVSAALRAALNAAPEVK